MQYITEKESNSLFGKYTLISAKYHVRSVKNWSRSLICLCCLDEEAVYLIERVVKTDQTIQMRRLIWIFANHTVLFVDITVFQKIQFVQLQKINIHIFGYNFFMLFSLCRVFIHFNK